MNKERLTDTDKLFEAASRRWDQGQLEEARKLFLFAAENGDVSSQVNMGVFCEAGFAGPKDIAGALRWYRKAARAGNVSAYLNIADLYRKCGNRRRTLFWLHRAAKQGDGEGQLALAKELLQGRAANARKRAKKLLKQVGESRSVSEDGRVEAAAILSKL